MTPDSHLISAASYLVPATIAETEETIRKSRFITYIAHTHGRGEAQAFIKSVRQQHPDARHHCWAFIAGTPDDAQQWGFSDDGEPSGTAGKPILARIQGSGLGELCAVVVRYSGGVKLGTGGLVRAYGGGVGHTLTTLETQLKIPQSELRVACQYNQLNDIQHLLTQYQGSLTETRYGASLELTMAIPTSKLNLFKSHLSNHFKGQISLSANKVEPDTHGKPN